MKELNELVKIDDNNQILLKEEVVKKIEAFNDMKKKSNIKKNCLR